MSSIGFLIGGALVNALALTAVITCLVAYLKKQLIKKERDMIRPSKIYNELK